ncbi:MAG: hypothetical protein ABJA66_06515 [Actinomycetota bacterium]
MSEFNRRDFLRYLTVTALIPLVGKEVSAQIKNFILTSPVNGFTYYWQGSLPCSVSFTRRQNSPRVARVDYKANGVLAGSGFPNPNPNQNFNFQWSLPIPSLQGDNYILTAEAIQVGTGNVIATVSTSFTVLRLPF